MPYRITTKQGTKIQYKIWDFVGEIIWEVINCLTKAGQERYKEVFGRSYPKKARRRNQVLLPAGQHLLPPYLSNESQVRPPRRQRASYARHYNPCPPPVQSRIHLPFTEQQAIQNHTNFDGYLYHIFLSNSFKHFTHAQNQANYTIFSQNCQWEDIMRLEIARIRLGISKLDQFLIFLGEWEELQVECGVETKHIPSPAHYLQCLKKIGQWTVFDFFHHLRHECERYHLYDAKLDIWDARFWKSYSSGQKSPRTNQPSDPAVGMYVHNTKFIGSGYLESRIINRRFRLPKFYQLVNPEWNDNRTFQTTFGTMVATRIRPAEVTLADGGPKGHKSSELVREHGSTPIFAAPRNAAGLILVTKKARKFYSRHIPVKFWNILDSTYDKRTNVEQGFAYDSGTYGLTRIPHLGQDLSTQFVGLINCEILLTALTAIKTDQFALITRLGAFRRLGLASQGLTLRQLQAQQECPVSP